MHKQAKTLLVYFAALQCNLSTLNGRLGDLARYQVALSSPPPNVLLSVPQNFDLQSDPKTIAQTLNSVQQLQKELEGLQKVYFKAAAAQALSPQYKGQLQNLSLLEKERDNFKTADVNKKRQLLDDAQKAHEKQPADLIAEFRYAIFKFSVLPERSEKNGQASWDFKGDQDFFVGGKTERDKLENALREGEQVRAWIVDLQNRLFPAVIQQIQTYSAFTALHQALGEAENTNLCLSTLYDLLGTQDQKPTKKSK
jgi:hypothetical protein